MTEARELAQAEAAAAVALREELERTRAQEQKSRREQELKFRDALQAELEFARGQVRALLDELKARNSTSELAASQRELTQRIEEQARAAREARAGLVKVQAPQRPLDLKIGGWVRHAGLDKDVEILALEGDQVVVAAGSLRMRTGVSELAAASGGKPKKAFPTADKQSKQLERAEQAAPTELATSSATCDVRGLRADEALRSVEQFLDRVLRSGEEGAMILHGHGTGALKQTIRQYLAHSPYVRVHRPGLNHEGGDGVTVVALKA